MNVEKALAVVGDYMDYVTVAEYYDEDADLREALGVLFPNFEYPDFSHKTMAQVYKMYRNDVQAKANYDKYRNGK